MYSKSHKDWKDISGQPNLIIYNSSVYGFIRNVIYTMQSDFLGYMLGVYANR